MTARRRTRAPSRRAIVLAASAVIVVCAGVAVASALGSGAGSDPDGVASAPAGVDLEGASDAPVVSGVDLAPRVEAAMGLVGGAAPVVSCGDGPVRQYRGNRVTCVADVGGVLHQVSVVFGDSQVDGEGVEHFGIEVVLGDVLGGLPSVSPVPGGVVVSPGG